MLAIKNTTRSPQPRARFAKIKSLVLGPAYDLSLVIIGDRRSRRLNREHRGKDKPANVLAFPYTKTSGEIFLNPRRSRGQVEYMFVHGLLHLKGMDHGSKMEAAEQKILARLF